MSLTYFADFMLSRRCSRCGNEVTEKPPQLQKKIVYLDQWVISEFANTLDPILSAKKTGKQDPTWLELYHRIERLVKLQVVVCPDSPLHHRESVVTPYLGVLRHLYEHLASGVSFKEPLKIHTAQLYQAFSRVVLGEAHDIAHDNRKAALARGSLTDWSDYIRISARFPIRQEQVALERLQRARADQYLAQDALRWKNQAGRTFAERYDWHRRDLTNVVLHCFDEKLFGIYSNVCGSMVEKLITKGSSRDAAVHMVREFLRSDEATRVPFCEITALLYAGMERKIADEGQRPSLKQNDSNDIEMIGAFLPYCDAITADNYFADLLRKPDILSAVGKYRTRIFSPNQRPQFHAYLDELERQVPTSLVNTVTAVYGGNWLKPYDTILRYHREREARSKE